MAYKGKYSPDNYKKYQGDPTNVIYRSSWELRFMKWLDHNPNVLAWGSETIVVPYKNPLTGKRHRYYPDFVVLMRDKVGKEQTYMIEIQPEKQTKPPQKKSRITKNYIKEVSTFAINNYKWKYAEEFCKDRKWKFLVLTENELGLNG